MKKFSRFLSLVLVLTMLLCVAPMQAFAAQLSYTDQYGTWEYSVNADGTLTLIKYAGDAKHVVIPLIIDGKRVSALGDNMFHENTTMATVVIPEGIQSIGDSAFSQCSKLETVQIPSTVTSIGSSAFASCENLGRIAIPSTVKTIGDNAFEDCPNVNIVCEAGSAAEAYIKSGQDDIKAYTIVERTPTVNTNTPADTSSAAEVNTKKNWLTYQFGKKINGKYEYTLVIEDKNLGFDLEAYMRQNPDNVNVMKLMDTRFQIISLTLADGTVFTPEEPLFMTTNDIHNERLADGTEVFMFQMFTNLPRENGEPVLEMVNFVSKGNKDELIDYTESVFTNPSDDATSVDSQVFDVTGELLEVGNSKHAHKEYQTVAPLVSANIWVSENKDVTTQLTRSGREVYVQAEEEAVLAFTYRWTDEMGKQVGFNSRKEVFDKNDIRTQIADSGAYYSDAGEVCTSQVSSITEVDDNTYRYVGVIHHPEVDKHNYTWSGKDYVDGNYVDVTRTGTDLQSDTFSYRDVTLEAKNAEAAYDRVGGALSREVHEVNLKDVASEHTDLISDRYIFGNTHNDVCTVTDTNGNEVRTETSNFDYRELRDHYYVGDTGHYVGWDWEQRAFYFDGNTTTPSNYTYTVTEYRSDGATWTKTEIRLGNQTSDCLENSPTSSGIQYPPVEVKVYQYDPGHASAADDWKPIEIKENDGTNIKYDLDAGKEVTCNVSDILQGTSSVIANDVSYNQQTQKDEMVEIMDEISNADEVLDVDFTQEVIDTVLSGPESKDLLDAVGITPTNPSATSLMSDDESAAEAPAAETLAAGETDEVETDEVETDDVETDEVETGGQGTDGQGTDGQGTDEQGTDGQGTDGQGTDGQGTDGQGTDGQGTDGQGTDGQGTTTEKTTED